MSERSFERNTFVKVVRLSRTDESLGYLFLPKEYFDARKEGNLGMVIGENVVANNAVFVAHADEGGVVGVYGTDELEVLETRDPHTALNILRSLRKSRLGRDDST